MTGSNTSQNYSVCIFRLPEYTVLSYKTKVRENLLVQCWHLQKHTGVKHYVCTCIHSCQNLTEPCTSWNFTIYAIYCANVTSHILWMCVGRGGSYNITCTKTMRRHSDIVTQNSETFLKGTSLFRLRRPSMCRTGAKERECNRLGRWGGTTNFLGRA